MTHRRHDYAEIRSRSTLRECAAFHRSRARLYTTAAMHTTYADAVDDAITRGDQLDIALELLRRAVRVVDGQADAAESADWRARVDLALSAKRRAP